MCTQTQDESKYIFAMKELLIEMKCIMYSCERRFWLSVHLPGRDRAGGGVGHWLRGVGLLSAFSQAELHKHWSADGFAVITQTKEKGSYCFKGRTIDQV